MPSDGTVSRMQGDSLSHRYWATSLPSAPPSQDTGHTLEQPQFSDLPGSSYGDRNSTLLKVGQSKGALTLAVRLQLLESHSLGSTQVAHLIPVALLYPGWVIWPGPPFPHSPQQVSVLHRTVTKTRTPCEPSSLRQLSFRKQLSLEDACPACTKPGFHPQHHINQCVMHIWILSTWGGGKSIRSSASSSSVE